MPREFVRPAISRLAAGPLQAFVMVNEYQSMECVDPPFTDSNRRLVLLTKASASGAILIARIEGGASMSKIRFCAFVTMLGALASTPANASLNCLKDHKPFKMASDTIEYSMTIAPGADCIQGLRFATMQIYAVWVLEKPKSGKLEMVGPGFRYFAKPNFSGTDKFSLVVVGKNLREEGYSTVEITVSRPDAGTTPIANGKVAASKAMPKMADAALAR